MALEYPEPARGAGVQGEGAPCQQVRSQPTSPLIGHDCRTAAPSSCRDGQKHAPHCPHTLLPPLARSQADQCRTTGGKGPRQPFQLKGTVKGAATRFLNVYS